MEIIVKSTKVLKTGTNDYGEWKLIKITTLSGEEYTTLAKDADTITAGASVNISDMDETEKGKSFKKFEIVAGGVSLEEPALTAKLPPEKRDSSTNASIEAQVAVKAITELWVAGKVGDTDQLVATARNWLMSKLSYWSSQGEAPKPQWGIEDYQTERIKQASAKYKGNIEAYTKVLKDAYGQTNYKKLNALQAEDLINRLTKGEGLLEELEPEDIPL